MEVIRIVTVTPAGMVVMLDFEPWDIPIRMREVGKLVAYICEEIDSGLYKGPIRFMGHLSISFGDDGMIPADVPYQMGTVSWQMVGFPKSGLVRKGG